MGIEEGNAKTAEHAIAAPTNVMVMFTSSLCFYVNAANEERQQNSVTVETFSRQIKVYEMLGQCRWQMGAFKLTNTHTHTHTCAYMYALAYTRILCLTLKLHFVFGELLSKACPND